MPGPVCQSLASSNSDTIITKLKPSPSGYFQFIEKQDQASTFTISKEIRKNQYLALFSIGRISARGGGWGCGGPPDESLSASLLSSAPRVLGHARRWLGIPRRGIDPADALKHNI
jgi:hypothetical protein